MTFNWFYMKSLVIINVRSNIVLIFLKVLAKDKYIDTYLVVIYVLTSSTMSVDVYSACVDLNSKMRRRLPCVKK